MHQVWILGCSDQRGPSHYWPVCHLVQQRQTSVHIICDLRNKPMPWFDFVYLYATLAVGKCRQGVQWILPGPWPHWRGENWVSYLRGIFHQAGAHYYLLHIWSRNHFCMLHCSFLCAEEISWRSLHTEDSLLRKGPTFLVNRCWSSRTFLSC